MVRLFRGFYERERWHELAMRNRYPSALTLPRSRNCAQRWSLAAAGDYPQIVQLP